MNHFVTNKNREGVYLNYALSANEYAVLLLNNNEATIAIQQNKEDFQQQIEAALAKIGIKSFIIESIP